MDYNNQNVDVQQNGAPVQDTVPVNNQVPPYNAYNAHNAVPPAYVPSQPANPNNGMAIGSLVCGIVGILLCCCCGVGAIVGAVGIVLAVLSRKQNDGKFSGLAMAGLICSIVAVVFGAGYLIYSMVFSSDIMSQLEDMGYYF